MNESSVRIMLPHIPETNDIMRVTEVHQDGCGVCQGPVAMLVTFPREAMSERNHYRFGRKVYEPAERRSLSKGSGVLLW